MTKVLARPALLRRCSDTLSRAPDFYPRVAIIRFVLTSWDNVADENPSSLGSFNLPLRLPGQYFDKETNLHYNYYRDYDPSAGIQGPLRISQR